MTTTKLILGASAVFLSGSIDSSEPAQPDIPHLARRVPAPAVVPQQEAPQQAKPPPVAQEPADLVTVTGVVAEPGGRPVSDVEIVLATWIRRRFGPHAGTRDDRRSRGIPPRGHTATLERNRIHSADLGLLSRPRSRHSTD